MVFPKNQASGAVETVLEPTEDVLASGFGKFCVREKAERMGRNPTTGKSMMLRVRKVVTFKCSRNLRDRENK